MVERTGTIDVVIADDQEICRIGMAEVLAAATDIRVIGQAECAEQLLGVIGPGIGAQPGGLNLCGRFRSGGGLHSASHPGRLPKD